MLKKTSNIENLHKENNEDEKKKRQKIQWDEITIAEHDKERGSRQKIDEAPTPFRYMSESDQSEAEYSSDGEHLARCKAGNTVADSWETLHAKLQYEKHLQDTNNSSLRLEQLETSFNDYSSQGETGTGDEMSIGNISDPNTTEFGEVITTEKKIPIRPAIKNTSITTSSNNGGPVTSPKPTKRLTSDKPRKSVLIKANDSSTTTTTNNNTHTPNNATTTTSSIHHPHHHHTNNINNTTTFSNSSNYWGNNNNTSNVFSSSVSPSTLPNNTTPSIGGGVGGSNTNSHQLFAGINNGSIDGDEEDGNDDNNNGDGLTSQQRELFKRKRAGHYNEFKVLQAMRAKMHDEDDDDNDVEEISNNKLSYPALVRQRSLEKVSSLQPTPIIHAIIPNVHNNSNTSHLPPPAALVTSLLPPAPPKTSSVNIVEVEAVPMEEN